MQRCIKYTRLWTYMTTCDTFLFALIIRLCKIFVCVLKFRGLRVPTKIYSPQKFLSIRYFAQTFTVHECSTYNYCCRPYCCVYIAHTGMLQLPPTRPLGGGVFPKYVLHWSLLQVWLCRALMPAVQGKSPTRYVLYTT